MTPRRYFIRFMRAKYLNRHRRQMQKYYLRNLPYMMVIVSLGLWAFPRPFQHSSPQVQGYAYVATFFLIWKMVQKFLPITRDADVKKRFPEKTTIGQKIVRATFWIAVFIAFSALAEKFVIITEECMHQDHQFREYDDEDQKLLEIERKTFLKDGTISFDALKAFIKETYHSYKESKKVFYDKITLDYDLAYTFDKKRLFFDEGPPVDSNTFLSLNHRGEYVEEKITVKNLKQLITAKMYFEGDKEMYIEFNEIANALFDLNEEGRTKEIEDVKEEEEDMSYYQQ